MFWHCQFLLSPLKKIERVHIISCNTYLSINIHINNNVRFLHQYTYFDISILLNIKLLLQYYTTNIW